jgi:hypothetical protein
MMPVCRLWSAHSLWILRTSGSMASGLAPKNVNIKGKSAARAALGRRALLPPVKKGEKVVRKMISTSGLTAARTAWTRVTMASSRALMMSAPSSPKTSLKAASSSEPPAKDGAGASPAKRLVPLLLHHKAVPPPGELQVSSAAPQEACKSKEVVVWSDCFTPLIGTMPQPARPVRGLRLLIDNEGRHSAWCAKLLKEGAPAGYTSLAVDLRGWGALRAHELSNDGLEDEWVAMQKGLGYDVPLLGLRLQDALAALRWLRDRVGSQPVEIYGRGFGAVIALLAGLIDETVALVHLEHLPASLIPAIEHPRRDFAPMFVPRLLSEVGDIVHLIGLLAPRPCRVASIMPATEFLLPGEQAFSPAHAGYRSAGAPEALCVAPGII